MLKPIIPQSLLLFPYLLENLGNRLGILGAGGINPETTAMKNYRATHKKITAKAIIK